jgi:predicted ester cyclase
MGIQPIGNKVEVGGLNILRIENGKFIEDWEDSDMLGWMMQPGMELRPKAEK